jgi:hypothetical protein
MNQLGLIDGWLVDNIHPFISQNCFELKVLHDRAVALHRPRVKSSGCRDRLDSQYIVDGSSDSVSVSVSIARLQDFLSALQRSTPARFLLASRARQGLCEFSEEVRTPAGRC